MLGASTAASEGTPVFADAVETASAFTFPYIALRRRADGSVYTLVASFVLLNADGWVATSAHVVDELLAVRRSLEADEEPSGPGEKPWDRITETGEIWAIATDARPQLSTGRVNRAADLAIGRLEPFEPSWLAAPPVLRDTATEPLRQGESVCRVGFPFHTVEASWDTGGGGFRLADAAFPVPRFVQDGVVSRFNRRMSADGASGLFIEVSTPGLRGQSGGPLIDQRGRVVGLQSQTAHLDLGFDARYAGADGSPVTERQFLNVGLASHVDELTALLGTDGIAFKVG